MAAVLGSELHHFRSASGGSLTPNPSQLVRSRRGFHQRAHRASGCVAMAAGGGTVKILGISGSLRQASFNSGVLKAAAKNLPDGVELTLADIGSLPMINTDLEGKGGDGGLTFPEVVEKWRKQVAAADAIIFSSPEYNYSVAPPLKNAIDWASRPPNQWDDKPAAIVSAGGGLRGLQSNRVLRLSGIFLNLHYINKPEVAFGIRDPGVFDSQTGELVSEDGIAKIQQLVISLRDWTKRLQ